MRKIIEKYKEIVDTIHEKKNERKRLFLYFFVRLNFRDTRPIRDSDKLIKTIDVKVKLFLSQIPSLQL